METSAYYTRIPNWTVSQSSRQPASSPSYIVPPSSAMLPSNMHPHVPQPANGYGIIYNHQHPHVFHPPNFVTTPRSTSNFLPTQSNLESQPQPPSHPQTSLKEQQGSRKQQLVFIPANIDKIMQSYNSKPQNSITTRVVKSKKTRCGRKPTAISKQYQPSSYPNQNSTLALPSIATVIKQQLPNQFELAPIRSGTKYTKS